MVTTPHALLGQARRAGTTVRDALAGRRGKGDRPRDSGGRDKDEGARDRDLRPFIVMLTSRFPFGAGEQFIEDELPVWCRAGARILLVPEKNDSPDVAPRPAPECVEVDERLTRRWRSPWWRAVGLVEGVASPVWRRELGHLRRLGRLDPRRVAFVTRTCVQVAVVRRMLGTLTRERGRIDLAYAYWLSVSADAAALERREGRLGHAVARCHNADIYEDRHPMGHHPLVRQVSGDLDLLTPIAQDGADFCVERYGFDPDKVVVSRLGVDLPDAEAVCRPTGEGLTVISVSTMTPFKRLDLLIDALAALSDAMPGVPVRWVHAGTGRLHDELAARVTEVLEPRGIEVEWLGQLDHDDLLAWYRDHEADVLVNTSSSEGIPVSMMEALVRQLPVIGTDVGGVREIVPADWLLGPDPSPDEIAAAIVSRFGRIKDPQVRAELAERTARRYDARHNFETFVSRLTELAGQR